jgi:hypothetical protein
LDYVYVCRPGDNEELRYSIRSTVKNLPEGRIWVVGGKPDWYTGDFIPVQQTGINNHANVWNQLKIACNTKEISDDFILMNDDFFTVKKLEKVEYFYGGTMYKSLENYADSGQTNYGYQRLFNKTYKHLGRRINKPLLDYELHVPMKMNKEKLLPILDTGFLHRSYYGNMYDVGGTETYDVKVYSNTELQGKFEELYLDDLNYLSSHDSNFEFILDFILRDMFPDPSDYESP